MKDQQEFVTATIQVPKVYVEILMEDFDVDDPVKAIEAAVEWSSHVYHHLTMAERLDDNRLEGFDGE